MNLAETKDRLFEEPRSPIDRVAVKMLFKGEKLIERPVPDFVKEKHEKLMGCLNFRPAVPPGVPDKIGFTWGRMRVVCFGYSERAKLKPSSGQEKSGSKGAVRHWVCQCACGNYEFRKQAKINKASDHDRCVTCQQEYHSKFLRENPKKE